MIGNPVESRCVCVDWYTRTDYYFKIGNFVYIVIKFVSQGGVKLVKITQDF